MKEHIEKQNNQPERATPETDEARLRYRQGDGLEFVKFEGNYIVPADFARALETELNAALAQNEALRGALTASTSMLERAIAYIPRNAINMAMAERLPVAECRTQDHCKQRISENLAILTTTPPAKA